MNNLLSFKPINSLNDVKLLRKFHDSVETEVRGLNGLGLEKKNFGAMLIPVLMFKVSAELKLIMSRSFGKRIMGCHGCAGINKDGTRSQRKDQQPIRQQSN